MPVVRNRLANRRQVSTVSLVWPPVSGNRYHITVGEYEDGRPGEVWVHGAKFDFITKQHARYLLDEWFREGIFAIEKMPGKANINRSSTPKKQLAINNPRSLMPL